MTPLELEQRWLIWVSGAIGINIDYRKSEAEQGMLMNLHKKGWTEGLKLTDFEKHHEGNEESVKVGVPLFFFFSGRHSLCLF